MTGLLMHFSPAGAGVVRAVCIAALLSLCSGCSQASTELVGWLEAAAGHPLAPLAVIAVFLASGFVAAPLSLVMIPTIVVYGPVTGSLWTAIGATLAGALFFWFGSRGAALAGRVVRGGVDRSRIGRLVERNGVVAVAVARNLPLGPYPLVNLALGASPVRMPHFLIGNLIGLTPWIVAYAVTGSELRGLLTDPSPGALLRFGLTAVGVVGIAFAMAHFLVARHPEGDTSESESGGRS